MQEVETAYHLPLHWILWAQIGLVQPAGDWQVQENLYSYECSPRKQFLGGIKLTADNKQHLMHDPEHHKQEVDYFT